MILNQKQQQRINHLPQNDQLTLGQSVFGKIFAKHDKSLLAIQEEFLSRDGLGRKSPTMNKTTRRAPTLNVNTHVF